MGSTIISMQDHTVPVTEASAPGGRPRKKPAPDTPFSRWLKNSRMTVQQLADKLELSRWAVYNLRSGHHKPSLEVANQIAEISNGKVPADSWGKTSRKASRGKAARAKRHTNKS